MVRSARVGAALQTNPSEAHAKKAPPTGLAPGNLSTLMAVAAAPATGICDALVPRGATPAIGYAVVPVLAANGRQPWVLFGLTVACTMLTFVGYFLEPSGAASWMSVFDRFMI